MESTQNHWRLSLYLSCIAACVASLYAARVHGDELDGLLAGQMLSANEWIVRVEYPGHERPHHGIELRDDGVLRITRDEHGDGHWAEESRKNVTAEQATAVRDAAQTLLKNFSLANAAHWDVGRDDDVATQVSLSTAQGTCRAWFRGREAQKDAKLKDDVARLKAIIKKLRDADGQKEPAKAQVLRQVKMPDRVWLIVVEESTVTGRANDASRRLNVKLYENRDEKTSPIIECAPQGREWASANSVLGKIAERRDLAAGIQPQAAMVPIATTWLCARRLTNNRRLEVSMSSDKALGVGVSDHIKQVIAVVNRELATSKDHRETRIKIDP